MPSNPARTASASSSSAIAAGARRRPPKVVALWSSSREFLLPTLVLIGVLLVWEAIVRAFRIPVFLLPAPSVIWTETVGLGPILWQHILATLTTILLGFMLSIVVSFPIGVLIAYSTFFANAVYPLLVLTQSIPKVALAPILVVLLGSGEMPRVVVTFLVAFFPLVIAIATGLMSVPPELVELGRSLKASRVQELLRIRLPWSVPVLFSGLKVAIALAVVGAVVGEFVAAERGLGYLINSSMAFFRTPIAFGAMIILSVIGIVLFQLVVLMERLLFPWSASAQVTPSA